MNSSSSVLTELCFSISTLLATIALGVMSWQLANPPVSNNTVEPRQQPAQEIARPPRAQPAVQRRVPQPQLRLMEVDQFQVDRNRSADLTTRKSARPGRSAARGRNRSPAPHWSHTRPQPDRQRPGIRDTPFSLDDFSDTVKNEIWWALADAAHRSGDVAYSYTLTTEAALKFASKYKVSVKEIFRFFRAGVKAEWRHAELPESDSN